MYTHTDGSNDKSVDSRSIVAIWQSGYSAEWFPWCPPRRDRLPNPQLWRDFVYWTLPPRNIFWRNMRLEIYHGWCRSHWLSPLFVSSDRTVLRMDDYGPSKLIPMSETDQQVYDTRRYWQINREQPNKTCLYRVTDISFRNMITFNLGFWLARGGAASKSD